MSGRTELAPLRLVNLTTAQRDALAGPTAGDTVWNTSRKREESYDGTAWAPTPKYTVCTSSTHPASPAVGDRIFETDTGKELTYQSATTLWTPAWNTAWGYAASVNITGATSSASAVPVNITGAGITFTAVANRIYRHTYRFLQFSSVAGDVINLNLTDNVGTLKGDRATFQPGAAPLAGAAAEVFLSTLETGIAAGSTVRKWRFARAGGTGTAQVYADATFVSQYIIEDYGPNGAPA